MKELQTSRYLFNKNAVGSPCFIKLSFQKQFPGDVTQEKSSQKNSENLQKTFCTRAFFLIKLQVVG